MGIILSGKISGWVLRHPWESLHYTADTLKFRQGTTSPSS